MNVDTFIENNIEIIELVSNLTGNRKINVNTFPQNNTIKNRTTDEKCCIYFTPVDRYLKCEKHDHHVFSKEAIDKIYPNQTQRIKCELCRGSNYLEQCIYQNKDNE